MSNPGGNIFQKKIEKPAFSIGIVCTAFPRLLRSINDMVDFHKHDCLTPEKSFFFNIENPGSGLDIKIYCIEHLSLGNDQTEDSMMVLIRQVHHSTGGHNDLYRIDALKKSISLSLPLP